MNGSFTEGVGPANDNCSSAVQLCSGQTQSASMAGATVDVCVGCSDAWSTAGNFCYEVNNTIWFSFTTNSTGGDASVNFSNITFNATAG